eukprot:5611017-Pyramimonas_sp.AAC.1
MAVATLRMSPVPLRSVWFLSGRFSPPAAGELTFPGGVPEPTSPYQPDQSFFHCLAAGGDPAHPPRPAPRLASQEKG